MTSSLLATTLLDTPALLASHAVEMGRLARSPDAASSIVQHPDWLQFELATRGGASALHVIATHGADGVINGYAPLMKTVVHARVAVDKRHIELYRGTGLRLMGESVVALPGNRAEVEAAIARAIQRDTAIRALSIQEAVFPNSFATVLASKPGGFRPVATNLLEQSNWTLRPPASLAAYLASLDGKRRKDLMRRVRNAYKQLGNTAKLRIFDAPNDMAEYARLLNTVYQRSWHAATAPIDWATPCWQRLFHTLARRGDVIGHMMMLGERPIAYVHGYRMGGRYLLDNIGYDEEFAPFGIGLALVFQAVQDLLERFPGETIDFGYGDNQYKRVLGTHSEPCGSLFLVRGLRAQACLAAVPPLRLAYRLSRSIAKSAVARKVLKRR